jgi:hypothetical protein
VFHQVALPAMSLAQAFWAAMHGARTVVCPATCAGTALHDAAACVWRN